MISTALSGQIFDGIYRIYRMVRIIRILSILFILSINSGNVNPMFENMSLNSDITRTILGEAHIN